jgi:methylphosphotriester-DNA--protein-cysteine methyltransferase
LFAGNTRGKIYGRLDCPTALRAIKRSQTYERYRVFFADEVSAIAAGFRPCAACMRDAYNKWRAGPGALTCASSGAQQKKTPVRGTNTIRTAYRPDKKR